MHRLDRRTFVTAALASTAGAAFLTSCGGDSDEAIDQPQRSADLTFLVLSFPDGFRIPPSLVAGIEQRLPFTVRDEIDYMRESAPETIDLAIYQGDTKLIQETLPARRDGTPTPYYPIRFTFPEPGEYTVQLADHPDVTPVPFIVTDRESVEIPQPGDTLPVVDTPTVVDARGVTPICTRGTQCPFHDHNLADVVGNGRPTVLLIATPGFCQTAVCGPVVELLIDQSADHGDVDFIHAEVYNDPSEFDTGQFPQTTDIVTALGLPFEPVLMAVDASGTIVSRLDAVWDGSELAEVLTAL